ncbi:MAG: ATPase, T2SS/T4P/T4SS family [Gemmatimonadota bacterium]
MPELATHSRADPGPRRILGALLLDSGAIRPAELDRALEAQRKTGERLGEAMVRLGCVPEESVARALAGQLGLPFEVGPLTPDAEALRLVRGAFARGRGVLPLRLRGRFLQVAVRDPLDLATLDDLQFQSGRRVEPIVTTPSALSEALTAAFHSPAPIRPTSGGDGEALDPRAEAPPESEEATAPPIVRLVDLLIRRSVEAGASDLHVEQGARDLLVRERIDGVLRRVTAVAPSARAALLSRIKILAGMDISVKRRPQDGGFPLQHEGRTLSVRVSTLPVEAGEKAVLRFLDPRSAPANLEALGFSAEDLGRLRALLRGGRGVVLAAGPTGSGKSSTLFGALGELNRDESNVVTLEDPIEYRVEGVNQVQVNPKSGLTFPAALRAVLRQDPDIIMVGEIRDRETAEIAMSAAITGHLVLSTIHTIDAPSGITRLIQMGVPAHLVAGGLAGIVAQRLVRRCCLACRGRAKGCPACHEGYRGRTGVFQLLTVTETLREMVARGADAGELRRRAEEGGMGTMAEDARRKVTEGVTTPHEVARVLREDPGEALPCMRCGGGLPPDGRGCPFCGFCRIQACACGRSLRKGWRYCPDCLRKVVPAL